MCVCVCVCTPDLADLPAASRCPWWVCVCDRRHWCQSPSAPHGPCLPARPVKSARQQQQKCISSIVFSLLSKQKPYYTWIVRTTGLNRLICSRTILIERVLCKDRQECCVSFKQKRYRRRQIPCDWGQYQELPNHSQSKCIITFAQASGLTNVLLRKMDETQKKRSMIWWRQSVLWYANVWWRVCSGGSEMRFILEAAWRIFSAFFNLKSDINLYLPPTVISCESSGLPYKS